MRALVHELAGRVATAPGEDWILRSSLSVRHEPKAMDSVFLPRDQKRNGVFMPYVLYAFGKLYANFVAPKVQQELAAMGHNQEEVGIAALLQQVAGARDRSGALGRERTVSFSAEISPRGRLHLHLVFGLPILATRPLWSGIRQCATLLVEPRAGLRPGTAGGLLAAARSEHQDFPQTVIAVLIPERGLVMEDLQLGAENRLESVALGAATSARLPLPAEVIETVLEIASKAGEAAGQLEVAERAWRIDGVLARAAGSGRWGPPSIVGLSSIAA
jgi:hypothetical protein